jgi:hypothetical protein
MEGYGGSVQGESETHGYLAHSFQDHPNKDEIATRSKMEKLTKATAVKGQTISEKDSGPPTHLAEGKLDASCGHTEVRARKLWRLLDFLKEFTA